MNFIAVAWDAVTSTTIFNCMKKAGFHGTGENEAEVGVVDVVDIVDAAEWQLVGGQGTFSDFVESDSHLITSDLQSLIGLKLVNRTVTVKMTVSHL